MSTTESTEDTILKLKTNHRFCADKAWGETLERIFTTGPNEDDVSKINSRIISSDQIQTSATSNTLPKLVYAVATNKDRCAMNY